MLAHVLKRILKYSFFFFAWHDCRVYAGSPLCFCTFFGARASALTLITYSSRREYEDHATSDYY